MNASSVSALLRRGGLNPLGSGSPRSREGIRVSNTHDGRVYVVADLVGDRAAAALLDEAVEIVQAAGLVIERRRAASMYLSATTEGEI